MIQVVFNVVKSLLGLVLWIFRPLKRLWCRRVKASEMDTGIPTMVISQSLAINMDNAESGKADTTELETWESWDTNQHQAHRPPPPQYSQSNAAYYQHAARPSAVATHRRPEVETEPEPEPDYFQGMIPDFKRPAKIVLKKKDNGTINTAAISMRLSAVVDTPMVGSELESWEEGEGGWGEEVSEDLSWEAEAALKEKRIAERQNRTREQQKKKQQRDAQRGLKKDSHLAVKIS